MTWTARLRAVSEYPIAVIGVKSEVTAGLVGTIAHAEAPQRQDEGFCNVAFSIGATSPLRSKSLIPRNKLQNAAEIGERSVLPAPLAQQYIAVALFFLELRKARDKVAHGGRGFGFVFTTERGFCVNPGQRSIHSSAPLGSRTQLCVVRRGGAGFFPCHRRRASSQAGRIHLRTHSPPPHHHHPKYLLILII